MFWIMFACFSVLGIYYYRMVQERCWDLSDRGFTEGTQKDICLDLVQLGAARYVPSIDQGYGKLCGKGNNVGDIKEYGDLEGYCENYKTTYILMCCVFAGCWFIALGLVNFLMILSTNYSIITRRYVKKFIKMDAIPLDGSTAIGTRAQTMVRVEIQPKNG